MSAINNMAYFVVVLALLALALFGCAAPTRNVPVVEPRPPISVPTATPMSPTRVQWKVYNADDIKRLAQQLGDSPPKNFVLYVLDTKNFEALAYNLAEMKRYILEQATINEFLAGVVNDAPSATAP